MALTGAHTDIIHKPFGVPLVGHRHSAVALLKIVGSCAAHTRCVVQVPGRDADGGRERGDLWGGGFARLPALRVGIALGVSYAMLAIWERSALSRCLSRCWRWEAPSLHVAAVAAGSERCFGLGREGCRRACHLAPERQNTKRTRNSWRGEISLTRNGKGENPTLRTRYRPTPHSVRL
jgi:hypothetical protein